LFLSHNIWEFNIYVSDLISFSASNRIDWDIIISLTILLKNKAHILRCIYIIISALMKMVWNLSRLKRLLIISYNSFIQLCIYCWAHPTCMMSRTKKLFNFIFILTSNNATWLVTKGPWVYIRGLPCTIAFDSECIFLSYLNTSLLIVEIKTLSVIHHI
jgi:hypothetical protein